MNILVAITSRVFQILLIFGMLGCYNSYNITVQVSDSGADDPSCVQNGEPCNTLTYALGQISQLSGTLRQSTTVMVNVTYNQTITSSFQYPFTSLHPLSVKVVGHDYAFIKLDRSSTLQVYQGSNSEFYWAWIGLGFIRNSGADITTSYTDNFVLLWYICTTDISCCLEKTAAKHGRTLFLKKGVSVCCSSLYPIVASTKVW